MLLGKRHEVHRDLIHVDVQVSLKPHGTCHIVNYISHYRILFFKMILLLLFISRLNYWCAVFDLILNWIIPSKSIFSLFEFFILKVNSRDDIEQCLVIYWEDTVGTLDQNVQGKHRVVRGSDHVVIVGWKDASTKLEHWWVKVCEILQDVSAKTRAGTSS